MFSKEGILIDVYYKDKQLFLTIKSDNKKQDFLYNFSPYFYISKKNNNLTKNDLVFLKNNLENLDEIDKTKKKNREVYKLYFKDVESLIKSREKINEIDLYNKYEYDIPFLYRFFLDKGLYNFKKIKFNYKDNEILSFKVLGDIDFLKDLNYLTFDIEVLPYNKSFPKPDKKECKIISICYKYNNQDYLLYLLENKSSEKNTKFFKKESDLINYFIKHLKELDPDILFTYNGDYFDLDYLYKRYKYLENKEFSFGDRELNYIKKRDRAIKINGIVHIDVYILMRLLNYLQVFNYPKLDLNTLYEKLIGKKKIVLEINDLISFYENKDYKKILEYNLDDVNATYELGINYYNIVFEISKLINLPLFDVLRISASQMIEFWFCKHYIEQNKLIPNKPASYEIKNRREYKFKGAFVKDPTKGFHENIAVVDFRSYHISLLISYNISPETIDLKNCDNYIDQDSELFLGHTICKDKKGFVPLLLKSLLDIRIPLKQKIKTLDKDSFEYRLYYARQYALKILLASTYGYMGFSGARWYSKVSLDIMYNLVREKIQETIKKFEDLSYEVIYSDTDSCFVKFKDLEVFKKDLEIINSKLFGSISLELEDVFKSGIFVSSRDKSKAAKKKYALIKENKELKIKGFEFVRRDWAPFVKQTQKEVLEILLDKKNPDLAISYIKDVVDKLKHKKYKNKDMVIQAISHKKLDSYKSINPAVFALRDAKDKGKDISKINLIEYIITDKPNEKSISKKARLSEFVNEGDYDINYYLENQLIPSILPILEVFDITKDEILTNTKQKGIFDY